VSPTCGPHWQWVREGRRGGGVLGRVGQKDWVGGKIRRGGGRWAGLDGDGFVFFETFL
jgi:hypothetical protein